MVEDSPDTLPRRRVRSSVAVLVLLLSFIFGTVGGIFGIAVLSTNNSLKTALHLENGLTLPATSTNKVVFEESNAVIDTVKKVQPSVVSIKTSQSVQNFFGITQTVEGGGTGFILTEDGLIATNKHVVSDPKVQYTVFTSDGKSYPAKITAVDPVNDFAVLKIDAKGLQPVELGDSDGLEVGQYVVAIGNALAEFKNTVTFGVISAKDRQVTAATDQLGGNSENLEGLLQTDAAINPGNSGGPLVNLKGQVVGINTAVAGNAQNIGFAIPINSAKSAIDSVRKSGKIIRPQLGIRFVAITKEIAVANKLPVDHGALVIHGDAVTDSAVIPGGPADKAGIKENDIITDINSQSIDDDHSLPSLLQKYNPGDTVTLKILHGGTAQTISVKLGSTE